MNSILQAFLDAMVNDDGSGVTGDLMDKTWWTDLIDRIDTVISLAGLSIEQDQTYYVSAASGSDTTGDGSLATPWATIGHALDALRTYRIAPGSTVTLQVDDGDYTITESVADMPAGIIITGKNTLLRQITSIQSSSGTSRNYTLVLNMFDVGGIAVGDECAIEAATGGTNPLALTGTYAVTDVDAINSRITIVSGAVASPSGAVTATAHIYKTRVKPVGVHGLDAVSNCTIQDLAIIGDSSADTYGIVAEIATVTVSNLAIRDFGAGGVLIHRNGSLVGDLLTLCHSGSDGLLCHSNGYANITNLIIAQISQKGIYCHTNGVVVAPDVTIYDAFTTGISCQYSGNVSAVGAIVQKCTVGLGASYNGHIHAPSCVLSSNISYAVSIDSNASANIESGNLSNSGSDEMRCKKNSFVNAQLATITTSAYAIRAEDYAFVFAYGLTIAGGGLTSPALNTQGNTYSYIKT